MKSYVLRLLYAMCFQTSATADGPTPCEWSSIGRQRTQHMHVLRQGGMSHTGLCCAACGAHVTVTAWVVQHVSLGGPTLLPAYLLLLMSGRPHPVLPLLFIDPIDELMRGVLKFLSSSAGCNRAVQQKKSTCS